MYYYTTKRAFFQHLIKQSSANANSIANEAKEASAGGPFVPKNPTVDNPAKINGVIHPSWVEVGPNTQISGIAHSDYKNTTPSLTYDGFGFRKHVDLGSNILQGLNDPIYNHDAANKGYVDSMPGVTLHDIDGGGAVFSGKIVSIKANSAGTRYAYLYYIYAMAYSDGTALTISPALPKRVSSTVQSHNTKENSLSIKQLSFSSVSDMKISNYLGPINSGIELTGVIIV